MRGDVSPYRSCPRLVEAIAVRGRTAPRPALDAGVAAHKSRAFGMRVGERAESFRRPSPHEPPSRPRTRYRSCGSLPSRPETLSRVPSERLIPSPRGPAKESAVSGAAPRPARSDPTSAVTERSEPGADPRRSGIAARPAGRGRPGCRFGREGIRVRLEADLGPSTGCCSDSGSRRNRDRTREQDGGRGRVGGKSWSGVTRPPWPRSASR
jgi:hypothetical protein